MSAREIEFLDEAPASLPDTDPPDADPPDPGHRRRGPGWWFVRAGALAVVAAAVAVWLATRPTPADESASHVRPSPAASSSAASSAPRLNEGGSVFCMSGLTPTADLVNAIRTALPDATLSQDSTYQCVRVYGFDQDRRLVYQAITADDHGVSVDVEVVARGPLAPGVPRSPRHSEERPGRALLGGFSTESAAVYVYVTAIGPPGATAPEKPMSRLADRLAMNPPGLDGIGLGTHNFSAVKGHYVK